MGDHPFRRLTNKGDRLNELEKVVIEAVVTLSVTVFSNLTFEQIYDKLLSQAPIPTGFTSRDVKEQLNRIEGVVMNTSAIVQRLQTDVANLQAGITTLTTAINTAITDIGNLAGSGDAAALAQVADNLEAAVSSIQSEGAALNNAENPPAPVTLAISPSSATVANGATQQFTSNIPSINWGANTPAGGTVSNGLYTAPASPTQPSDIVQCTTADGTQTASASITLSGFTAPASAAKAV